MQDIRYALRMLRRNPGFAAVVVLTLALGIGMNTAVFSVINAALVRPLPYPDAERLVWLTDYDYKIENHDNHVSRPAYLQWKREAQSFEAMTAYGNQDLALLMDGQSSQERIASISGEFWKIAGARTARGRLFAEGEERMMVISHGLFLRRFGGDARALGKIVTLNGHAFTIAGVLEPGFRFEFPQQFAKGDEVRGIDAYIAIPRVALHAGLLPARPWEEALVNWGPAPYNLRVVGKVKEDVTMEQARAEMETVYARTFQNYPDYRRQFTRFRFASLQEAVAGESRQALFVLLAGVGFVLLIGCANIANLLLARASKRQREIAIRAAVGAGRGRVIRQMLTESAVLAGLGGCAGLLLAHWAIAAMRWIAPHAVPRLADASIDAPVLIFTLVLSAVTGALFGLGPALSAWKIDLHNTLKRDAGGAATGGTRMQMRGVLIAGQLALSIMLLTGAGLMVKSFWKMNAHPDGFTPSEILVMRVPLSGPAYTTWLAKGGYLRQVMERSAATPGVRAAGVDCGTLNGTVKTDGTPLFAAIRAVSPSYLRALGVRLLDGQWPKDDNLFGVLVNESFARSMRVKGSVVGRHVQGSVLNEAILGVVADFKYRQLDAAAAPEIYMSYERFPLVRSARVVVRAQGDPARVMPAVRKAISEIDATQPVYEVQTLEQALADSIAPRRFNTLLLTVFAMTALAMALIGIYGVIAYAVSQRSREIGIRMALGASGGHVVRMIVEQGMRMALVGIALGLALALLLTRVIGNLLFGVEPHDPFTFAAVAVGLTCAAVLACWIPAQKAASLDPLAALRQE